MVIFLTAGFPDKQATMELVPALVRAGADIVELGVPFSDPLGEGPVIQESSFKALQQEVSLKDCLDMVETLREQVGETPLVLMGYYNPFVAFGSRHLMTACVESGIDGFIIVDLPPEEGEEFFGLCDEFGLSFVPLLTPETTPARITLLTAHASSFVYCVSQAGVTGARQAVPPGLEAYLDRTFPPPEARSA